MSGNFVATLALIIWFPVSILLFRFFRPTSALTAVVIGGVLFLPERITLFDPPVLPAIGKAMVISLSALFGVLADRRAREQLGLVRREALIVTGLFALSSLLTFATNTEVIRHGPTTLPGLSISDALLMTTTTVISYLVPFWLAKASVSEDNDVRRFSTVIIAAALVYSLFALFEVRMSPQLNNMVYGFAQHSYLQTIRMGGWRPIVFMGHGLALGVFISGAVLLSLAFTKEKSKIFRVPNSAWTAYLAIVLVLCKSTGAIVYAVLFGPLLLISRGRLVIWAAASLAALLLLYPMLRGVIDTDGIVSSIAEYDVERAQSLAFRFDNEADLLERAMERPLFGWGIYSRGRVFDQWGEDQTVTDGSWIIMLGIRGLFGFLLLFGVLVYPVFQTWRKRKLILNTPVGSLIAAFCLLVGVRSAELIPNGLFSCLPFFLSGALAGLVSRVPRGSPRSRPLSPSTPQQKPKARVRPGQGIIIRPVRRDRSKDL